MSKTSADRAYAKRPPPSSAPGEVRVRSARTGKFVTVKGYGALKDSAFSVRKSIDLTRPIAAQVSKAAAKAEGKPPRKPVQD